MQSTMPTHPREATTADPKGLALFIPVGLLAASVGALYTVYARRAIGRATATAFAATDCDVIDS